MPVTRIPKPTRAHSDAELERQYLSDAGWQTVETSTSGNELPPQWTVDDATGAIEGNSTGSAATLQINASPDGDQQALDVSYADGAHAIIISTDAGVVIEGQSPLAADREGRPVHITAGSGQGIGQGAAVNINGGHAGVDSNIAGSIVLEAGDAIVAAGGGGGAIVLVAGDGEAGGGTGGSVSIRSGNGDTDGTVRLYGGSGDHVVAVGEDRLGFFNRSPQVKASIEGALSAVTDPAAKDVLTSLLIALADSYGFVADGTT